MNKKILKILVTGGAGFIGSAFVRRLIADQAANKLKKYRVIVIDNLTYAGDLQRLKEIEGRYQFYKVNIRNKKRIEQIFKKEKPDIVMHFAAESHVDRSINDATPFMETNICGTQVLMDASRKYKIKRFVFISTDEVYGEIARGKFNEESPFKPNSPYAASKASADLLAQAYVRTYSLPAIIIRPCNNYGPWQYPEKLIPVAIESVLRGMRVPVYAKGKNIREWLYVDDCASGIMQIMRKGKPGQIYNLGSGIESRNIDTVKLLLKNMGVGRDCFDFVRDRPGHDIRYSLDSSKVKKEIGWKSKIKLEEGIKLTIHWYLKNKAWLFSRIPSHKSAKNH